MSTCTADRLGRRPWVLPAQGNALGPREHHRRGCGPTGQSFPQSSLKSLARWADNNPFALLTQGDALGWENNRPSVIHPGKPTPRRPPSLLTAISFIFVIATTVGCGTDAYDQKPPESEKPTAESDDSGDLHWPKVTISKETTYFTEPLRPDGGVDYVAAFNRRLSEGVTPENNALIPLLQATGPKDIDKKIRKRYFQMLGIPELPEEGDYLIGAWDLSEYKEAKKAGKEIDYSQKIWGQHDEARKSPWSKQDFPLWATALERDEKLLDKLVEGLQRSRLYSPLVLSRDGGNLLVNCDWTAGFDESRWVIRLLQPRAMLRLHEGDVADAWQDIMAMYRLARLGSQRPFIIDWMGMCVTFDNMASSSAVILSQHEGLSATQARECQKQLRSLPTARSIGEICNEGERCSNIENVLLLANSDDSKRSMGDIEDLYTFEGSPFMGFSPDPKLQQRKDSLKKLLADKNVDWTEVLRHYNAWFDRIADACSRPNPSEGISMLETLRTDTLRQAHRTADLVLPKTPEVLKSLNSKTKAQYVAELVELPSQVNLWRQMLFIEQCRQAREHMTMLAFALAGYRAEHDGEYPNTLAQLVPTYIDAIPKDPFTDGDFRYRAEDGGYLLYSVGQNGKDDGGFGRGNYPDSATEEQRKEWDDVSIRTPRKKSD